MAKSIFDELTGYRLKVERDGREIVNIPGIMALPGALIAPKMSIIGTVAASLLGCDIHLEGEDGGDVNIADTVRKAAETVADTAKETAKTIKEEMDRAWESVSADDPSDETDDDPPRAEDESGEEIAQEPEQDSRIPTIQVNPDDSEQA